MRSFIHLPNASDSGESVDISYYRQLALIHAYGWLNYNLIGDIYIPNTKVEGAVEDSFYGVFTKSNQYYGIYAVADAGYSLTMIYTQTEIVVRISE